MMAAAVYFWGELFFRLAVAFVIVVKLLPE